MPRQSFDEWWKSVPHDYFENASHMEYARSAFKVNELYIDELEKKLGISRVALDAFNNYFEGMDNLELNRKRLHSSLKEIQAFLDEKI